MTLMYCSWISIILLLVMVLFSVSGHNMIIHTNEKNINVNTKNRHEQRNQVLVDNGNKGEVVGIVFNNSSIQNHPNDTMTTFQTTTKATTMESNIDRIVSVSSIQQIVNNLSHNKATTVQLLDFMIDLGGIPNDSSYIVCDYNTKLLSIVLQNFSSNRTIRIPTNNIFYFHCSIYAANITNTILVIDGIIRFEKSHTNPYNQQEEDSMNNYTVPHPIPCIMIDTSNNITITSNNATSLETNYRGLIDGQGSLYWGIPGIGYLLHGEYRPRLLQINQTSNILIENIILQDSPYHTLYLEDVHNVEIRNISIIARRTTDDGHSLIDLSAFNTDGIDVSGSNVYIHDCDIYTQDDCIAVKDNNFNFISKDMIFENINASGLGFVIGSIGNTTVSNITFRNSYLYKPIKGIYMKFHSSPNSTITGGGHIENITYSNIIIEHPIQWPIWIGPAQQGDDASNICHANPCSLCWPQIYTSHCNVVQESYYTNIEFNNITIINPTMSTGVILGASVDTTTTSTATTITDPDKYIQSSNPPHINSIIFNNVLVQKKLLWETSSENYNRRMQTFPALALPIHDYYVLNDHDWHVLTTDVFNPLIHIIVFIISLCIVRCLLSNKQTSRKNTNITINSTQPTNEEEITVQTLTEHIEQEQCFVPLSFIIDNNDTNDTMLRQRLLSDFDDNESLRSRLLSDDSTIASSSPKRKPSRYINDSIIEECLRTRLPADQIVGIENNNDDNYDINAGKVSFNRRRSSSDFDDGDSLRSRLYSEELNADNEINDNNFIGKQRSRLQSDDSGFDSLRSSLLSDDDCSNVINNKTMMKSCHVNNDCNDGSYLFSTLKEISSVCNSADSDDMTNRRCNNKNNNNNNTDNNIEVENQNDDNTRRVKVSVFTKRMIVYGAIILCLVFNVLFLFYPQQMWGITTSTISSLVFGKLQWENVNQYYQCTGVINGIATGTTWPVPSCFQDNTTRTS